MIRLLILALTMYSSVLFAQTKSGSGNKEVEESLNPDKLQFLLDIGGSKNNPEIGRITNKATAMALDKVVGTQRVAFIAAALEVVNSSYLEGYMNPIEYCKNYLNGIENRTIPRHERDVYVKKLDESRVEVWKFKRMLFTAQQIVGEMSEEEIEAILGEFENFQLEYLLGHASNPKFKIDEGNNRMVAIVAGLFVGGLLPTDSLLRRAPVDFLAEDELNQVQSARFVVKERDLWDRAKQETHEVQYSSYYPKLKDEFLEKMNLELKDPNPLFEEPFSAGELLACGSKEDCKTFCRKHFRSKHNDNEPGAHCFWAAFKIGLEKAYQQKSPEVPESWKTEKLPPMVEKVRALPKWLAFTREHSIYEETDSKTGKSILKVVSTKVIGNPGVSNIAGSKFKQFSEWQEYTGFVKYAMEGSIAVNIVQVLSGTKDANQALAETAVEAMRTILKNQKIVVPIEPGHLTHHFSKSFESFANYTGNLLTKHGDELKKVVEYTGSAAEKKALKGLADDGVGHLSKYSILAGAVGQAVAVEAATDVIFRGIGALYTGKESEKTTIAGKSYNMQGRQGIQLTGIEHIDYWRNKSTALNDEYENWKANMVSNVTGYVAAGVTGAVATPIIFGAAAAAGLPSGGVGGAVVAIAGYTAAGYVSSKASEGAKSLVEGVDQSIALYKIESRFKGIWLDMEGHSKSLTAATTATEKVAGEAKGRLVEGHELRFMAYVRHFDFVDIFESEHVHVRSSGRRGSKRKTTRTKYDLLHFKIHQRNGNFLDSERATSWTNWLSAGTWLNEHVSGSDSETIKEARLIFDFYNLQGDQGQWDPHAKDEKKENFGKVINVGKVGMKGCIIAGIPGEKIIMKDGGIHGSHEENSIRVLSNGVVMTKDEEDPGKWVIKGTCKKYDLYIRKEAGEAAGRYTCFNNQYKMMDILNNDESRPVKLAKAEDQSGNSEGESASGDDASNQVETGQQEESVKVSIPNGSDGDNSAQLR